MERKNWKTTTKEWLEALLLTTVWIGAILFISWWEAI